MDRRIGNKQIFMRFITIVLGCTFLCADGFRDPSFEFNYPSSDIHVGADSVGAFNGTIHNISSGTITIAVVRRVNDLPNNWTSSVCLGMICYNETIDSASVEIGPGDSSACGILAWISGAGAGTVQLDIFDLDSGEHLVVDVNFYAGMMALDDGDFQPCNISLFPGFPNPFNPVTTIRFEISVESLQAASLQIFDLQGRLVVTLVKGDFIMGEHEIQWNASNYSSGIYFAELVSGNFRQVQKLVLMK